MARFLPVESAIKQDLRWENNGWMQANNLIVYSNGFINKFQEVKKIYILYIDNISLFRVQDIVPCLVCLCCQMIHNETDEAYAHKTFG